MGRPLRVLWLVKGLGRGGAEQLLVSAARYHDPERVTLHAAYVLAHKDHLVDDLRAAGVTVHCLAGGWPGRGWVPRLRRLVADGAFDVVHTHSPVPATAARLLAPRRTRMVHTEHNVWARYRTATRLANAVTLHRNAAVLGVSEGVTASVRPLSLPGRPAPAVRTLLHGIDPDGVSSGAAARSRARATLGLPDDTPVLGSVANFTPKKDQRTLLEAMTKLDPAVQLVLIGDGPLRGELERAAVELGVADRVRFLGVRDDVADLLPAFDLFVLPSLHEGLSVALIEALAAGVPCVASDVGGIPEIVADGDVGRLVPPGDPPRLAEAISGLLDDCDTWAQMAQNAMCRARRFSIEPACRELEELYEAVVA